MLKHRSLQVSVFLILLLAFGINSYNHQSRKSTSNLFEQTTENFESEIFEPLPVIDLETLAFLFSTPKKGQSYLVSGSEKECCHPFEQHAGRFFNSDLSPPTA